MTADRKVSIYMGPPILAALDACPDQSRSGRLNYVAEVYMAIVQRELTGIRWTRAQWCAVMDVLNGAQIGAGGEIDWLMAWANLADAPEMGAKWGIDVDKTAAEWRAFGVAKKAAVYEVAMRFWSRAELPTDAALAAAGVIPSDKYGSCTLAVPRED